MWFLAAALIVFVAGCGGGSNNGSSRSSAKAITSYSLNGATGIVNESAKTIAVTMPNGTAVTALVATFTTTGSSVKVGSVAQISATTANNFSAPLAYLVTAEDDSNATYTVTVTVAPVTAKAVTTFSLGGSAGTVNESVKSISITMPNGTDVRSLPATFTTSGKTVTVNGVTQISGVTRNNFTSPVVYTVTDGNGATVVYSVTVTVASITSKAITSFSLAGVAGTVNESARTIAVTLPYGKNVTALIATFTTSGKGVKIGSVTQTSGVTANNFSTPVSYLVTAADDTTTTYVVTVTVAQQTAKTITAFSINGVSATVTEAAKTITLSLPNDTDVTALVATFTSTGENVKVGAVVQQSGITPNNFTNPVVYTVAAADGTTTADYTVTVSRAAAKGPGAVGLGTAGNFVILAKSGVSTTGITAVVGDIGLSPAAASFITGFAMIADATNTFATSAQVTGRIYASNYTPPTPAIMTTAVADMETAFTDAAGRVTPDFTNLGAGDISGLTLVPGLYKWGTGVLITNAGVTISGGANDIWIFQIAEDLTVNNSAMITLIGGAQAKNIFWQVAGKATLGTLADFKGIILSKTLISLNTGAVMTGRALAQTEVTLDATRITAP
jgi:hypothetical protein